MNYSESEFPMQFGFGIEYLENIWKAGWLDEFSDEHFLIKTINGNFPNFRTSNQTNAISPCIYTSENNSLNFILNFSQLLGTYIKLCGEKNSEKFIKDQLSAGKNNYNEDIFFQALHEMHVLRYFTMCGDPQVEYEPTLGNNGKNPEFRIINKFVIPSAEPNKPMYGMQKYIFDIEVKSIEGKVSENVNKDKPYIIPLKAIQYKKRNKLELFCKKRKFQLELPDVKHLKDFVNSAADKFVESIETNHFNIIVINWTHREIPDYSILEPLSILDNEINGLFKNQEIGLKFGLKKSVYDKISAIFICSYPIQSIIFHDIRWAMMNYKHAILLNPNLSKEQKEKIQRILSTYQRNNPKYQSILTNLTNDFALSSLEGIDEIIEDIHFC